MKASEFVGKHIKPGAIICYESTVYPGATEEVCGPILEKVSGLKCGVDFKLAYSPERINPGDTVHTLETVTKVVSGQDMETLARVAAMYGGIVPAGVHKAASIKVACLLAAPEGVARFHGEHPDVDLYTAAVDSHLDAHSYIVPGLGDAGDRLYGTK